MMQKKLQFYVEYTKNNNKLCKTIYDSTSSLQYFLELPGHDSIFPQPNF